MDVKLFSLFAKKKATAEAIAGMQAQIVGLINGAGIFAGYVDKFADLPAPADYNTKIWVVKTASGIPLINRKESGLYFSDGASWNFLDSSNSELAKFTVGADSLVTSNLVIEGSDVAPVLDTAAGKLMLGLSEATRTALNDAAAHKADTANPHAVTKEQVGLSDVDNTSDASKPISDAVQTALNAKEGSVTAGTAAQYYRGDKTWQDFDTEVLGAVLAGLVTSDTAIANGNTLIAALGRLQGQISSISTPNKFNIDLSSGASAANCYFDDSYYHLFGSGTLTAAGAAQFPRLPLVGSIAEANAHAAMVSGSFHRWLIAFGGENDTTFDQLANSQPANSGLFSGTTFLGGLSTGTTDIDEQPINTTASEFFIIPVARDASYIYYITAAYIISPNYTAAYGNKSVIFYFGTGGLGSPMAPVVSSAYGHSNAFSVRYATSLTATQGQSIWMQLTVKKRNG